MFKYLYVLLFPIVLLCGCKKEVCTEMSCKQLFMQQEQVDTAMDSLVLLISNIQNADFVAYNAKDDRGNTMDCAKIIAYNYDTLIAVYHSFINNHFVVNMAISIDLQTWKFQKMLAEYASQPTIFITPTKMLYVAWEQEPYNHLHISCYASINTLKQNSPIYERDLPHTLSTQAEGTPNIYQVTDSFIKIGFHYYCNGVVDREASGIYYTDQNWITTKEPCLDAALLKYSIKGNIGDRDAFSFLNRDFLIIEAQDERGDFGTWKSYIYSPESNVAKQVTFQTHAGSANFANPTLSVLNFKNGKVILVTTYIHEVRAAYMESGSLIFYKYIQ